MIATRSSGIVIDRLGRQRQQLGGRREADHARQRGIDRQEATVARRAVDAFHDVVEQAAIARLARAQRAFSAMRRSIAMPASCVMRAISSKSRRSGLRGVRKYSASVPRMRPSDA